MMMRAPQLSALAVVALGACSLSPVTFKPITNAHCRDGCPALTTDYLKASNTAAGQQFGRVVALSADRSTLAIGAPGESSAAKGVDGNQADTSAPSSGAVYVFVRNGPTWKQQAYIKASNTRIGDSFGWCVALSADGATLAIGAPEEDSRATGVDGNEDDTGAGNSGAVYVFARTGTTWAKQAYVKASNTDTDDEFGTRVALSADGQTLAVAAPFEDSASVGVDGNQTNRAAVNAGAVYLFARSGTAWSQQAYIKASNTDPSDGFGWSVALSGDGSTLAVGAVFEDSAATGINGIQTSNGAHDSGAVYVFARDAGTWRQHAYVKASNTGDGDLFGVSVALSGDGSTLAVGSLRESSAGIDVDGDQLSNTAPEAGAAYVFVRGGTVWYQQAYVKASNTTSGDWFGASVAVSEDGSTLAVGATRERSAATGVLGNELDHSANGAGAVYEFTTTGATWVPLMYIKASNTGADDRFGTSIALSSDGQTLVAGAPFEDSAATGADGNSADDSATDAGAVYVVE